MKKAYYAHCMADYDTPREEEDIKTIKEMGFKVENPNCKKHKSVVAEMKRNGAKGYQIMEYFISVASKCDVIIFRALPDGSISAGVHKEIMSFVDAKRPVAELPTMQTRKAMSIRDTCIHINSTKRRR